MACSDYSIFLPTTTYGDIVSTSVADNLGAFSVSYWIKTSAISPPSSFADILFKIGGGHGWNTFIYTGESWTTGSAGFFITGTGGSYQINSTVAVDDDVWHNIVCTWDGTTALIYVDGVNVTNILNSPAPGNFSNSGAVSINASTVASAYYGELDDVWIWGRTLSPSEASTLYAGGTPSSTNLLIHWAIEEGSGNILNDTSGNANTLTFNTSPTWSTDTPSELPSCTLITLSLSDSIVLSDEETSALAIQISDSVNITDTFPNSFTAQITTVVPAPTPVVETLVKQLLPASAKVYFRMQQF